jgi:hypothetical protein
VAVDFAHRRQLLGEKEGEPLAYVGESEDIGSHIKSHDAAKDWGSMAVLVTTAGNKLNTITRGCGYGHFPDIMAAYELQPSSRSWPVSGCALDAEVGA